MMSSKILKQFAGAMLLVVVVSTLGLTQGTAAKPPAAKPAAAPAKPSDEKSGLIDINTASKKDLTTLAGINDARAQKIIDGRPYKNKAQLKSSGIINEAEYNTIQAKIIAKQPKK